MAKKKLGKAARKRPGVRNFNKKKKSTSPRSTPKKKISTKNKTSVGQKIKPSIDRPVAASGGKSEKRKRVSFSSKLVESSSTTPKNRKISTESDNFENEITPSTPLKPILKSRLKKIRAVEEKSSKAKKIRLDDENENLDSGEKKLKKKKLAKVGDDDGGKKTKGPSENDATNGQKPEIMSRKEKKEHLLQLKAKRKPYFDLAVKAKKLWEQIRNQRKRKTEDRQRLIDELYRLVEGKVLQLIYAHDTVRVVQCLMALKGNTELRTKLFDEVKEQIIPMSKSKYAKFFVIKMLKYGTPAQREFIMQRFYGKIPQLMKHAVAAEAVEYSYNEYANALQRSRMISEFYSNEFALFKVDEAITLENIFVKEPERKPAILETMKEHISDLSTKPVLKYSLIHRLIREFLNFCSESDRKEIIDSLKERVVEMVHTKDGAYCSMRCIWYGTPKERKLIVRTLKSLVTKLCQEEHGHLLLLAIFDSVDDTLLVQKVVLKEIIQHMDEIVKNKHGLKVLYYLLEPRCGIHFMKPIVTLLSEGDNNPYSKKDKSTVYQELLTFMSPVLLKYCEDNMKELMADTPMFVLAVLQNAVGDKTDAYRALCVDVLAEEFVPMNMDHLHAVENPQSHFVLKRLIKKDKEIFGKGEKTFSETLIDELSPDHFLSWMSCNKGAFTLLFMYETEIPAVKEKIESVVKSSGGKKKLKQYTFPAAKLLAQKVR